MLDRLTGKVAVVTGASRGIGRAIALRLAQEGAAVVINYNGSKERAQEVKTEIESAGGTAQIMQCDVADAASCDEMFQTIIKEFGRIDILVNNAGITRDGLLMKMAEEDFVPFVFWCIYLCICQNPEKQILSAAVSNCTGNGFRCSWKFY